MGTYDLRFTIRDLVHLDEQAEFVSDVQLDYYDVPVKNRQLLKNYLFTTVSAVDSRKEVRRVSSLKVLEDVIDTFLIDGRENRYVLIADYGHGKTHFALALANFFSKPIDSEEIDILQKKIRHACSQPARAKKFQDFKESRGEFLVVRLRGDKSRSLKSQFLEGLEKALREHEGTKDATLPFWFSEAEKFFNGLSGEDRDRANIFLAQHDMDVALLFQYLREKRSSVYDVCIETVRYLRGVRPDFGSEISLSESIDWAVEHFCGDGKPYGGILVLFDEFSLFVENYAERRESGYLQDLLNGIAKHRGRTVFLAFAQHDPVTLAERLVINGQKRNSLLKELTRLRRRYQLYSVLESVIDAYLKQNEERWRAISQDARLKGPLFRAGNMAWEHFSKRYERELHWDFSQFQETVTKGCYPLHPLTTALLCNIRLSAVPGNPRNVLGFVFEQLSRKGNEQVVEEGTLNWVVPAELVDYFGERLAGDYFVSYRNAVQTMGSDITDEEQAVLKALLLQNLAGIKATGYDQLELLAEMSGLDLDDLKPTLKSLIDLNAIRRLPFRKEYSFWAASANPQVLEHTVQKYLDDFRWDWNMLLRMNQDPKIQSQIGITVSWGYPADWAAEEFVFTEDQFTVDNLKQLVKRYEIERGTVRAAARGYVLWLLARNEEEMKKYHLEAARILKEAFPGEHPPAVTLVLPEKPTPQLLKAYQRKWALRKFTQSDREEVGFEMFSTEINSVDLDIMRGLTKLKGESQNYTSIPRPADSVVVPQPYQTPIRSLRQFTLTTIIKELYQVVYPYRPPEFFTQYKLTSTKLRDVVKSVAGMLIQNNRTALAGYLPTKSMANDMVSRFLINQWQMLTSDYTIRVPGDAGVRRAWQTLDEYFNPDGTSQLICPALEDLFNLPYGYDYHTLLLLFAAWYGYHHPDIQLSMAGRRVGHQELVKLLKDRGGKTFYERVCAQNFAIARRRPEEIEEEVRQIIGIAQTGGLGKDEATDYAQTLWEFAKGERGSEQLREEARETAEALDEAVQLAEAYDRGSDDILKVIFGSQTIDEIAEANKQLKELPRATLVQPRGKELKELQSLLQRRLNEVTQTICERYSQLRSLEDYSHFRRALLREQKRLQRFPALHDCVRKAIDKLEENKKRLEREAEEEPIRAKVRAMSVRAPLQQLYEYRDELRKMSGFSEPTMSLIQEKFSHIEVEIDRLEKAAIDHISNLDSVQSLQQSRTWRDHLLQIKSRYENTEWEQKFTEALAKGDRIIQFFEDLREISRQTAHSPADVDALKVQLDALAMKFSQVLNPARKEKLDETKSQLDRFVQVERRLAQEKLEKIQVGFEMDGNPYTLLRELQTIPAFLPEPDRPKWEELRQKVQDKIEQDVQLKIENQFLRIRDRRRREAIVQRLQQLLDQDL